MQPIVRRPDGVDGTASRRTIHVSISSAILAKHKACRKYDGEIEHTGFQNAPGGLDRVRLLLLAGRAVLGGHR